MRRIENNVRDIAGFGGTEPSPERLLDAGRPAQNEAERFNRLNLQVISLAEAVAGLQRAVLVLAAELDRIDDASR
jgi:hypothetical protein